MRPSLPVAAGHRRPQHLLDPRGSGRQHHQPVEAERDAATGWHGGKCGKKVFVDRVLLAIAALPLRHRVLETAALLGRVGDLGKAVSEFDAASIELETLREARV